MATDNPRSTAQIAGHPIHPMVIAFPIACFVLAFVSDLAFAATSNGFWATASLWLLGIGLVTAALAAVTGLVEVLGDDRVRNLSDTRLHAIGNALALLIAAFNWYWRFDHGSSVIVPTGVVLSGLVVLGSHFRLEGRRNGFSPPGRSCQLKKRNPDSKPASVISFNALDRLPSWRPIFAHSSVIS